MTRNGEGNSLTFAERSLLLHATLKASYSLFMNAPVGRKRCLRKPGEQSSKTVVAVCGRCFPAVTVCGWAINYKIYHSISSFSSVPDRFFHSKQFGSFFPYFSSFYSFFFESSSKIFRKSRLPCSFYKTHLTSSPNSFSQRMLLQRSKSAKHSYKNTKWTKSTATRFCTVECEGKVSPKCLKVNYSEFFAAITTSSNPPWKDNVQSWCFCDYSPNVFRENEKMYRSTG